MAILARGQITVVDVSDGDKGDKGDPGRDAVAYELVPVREKAEVDRDRSLNLRLEYEVVRHSGGTQTVVDTSQQPECLIESVLYTRNLQTGLQQGVPLTFTRGKLSSATYALDNYGSPLIVQELTVQLLVGDEVVDSRYIPIVMKPNAVTEIDTAVGRISNTVYGSATSGDYGIVNYITDITQRIDSIDLSVTSMKPGGGNLVINGDFGDPDLGMFGNMGVITRGIRTDQGAPGFAKVLTMDCTAANQGLYLSEGGQEVLYPMKPGLEYVLSFLVKASAPTDIHVGNGQSGKHFYDRKTVDVGTAWKRVEYTFRPRYAATWIKIYSAAPATIYLTAIQVELGNKATEWDNTQEAVRRTGINIRDRRITLTSDNVEVRNNSGTTTLLVDSRGKLTASLIDVNSLFAQNIDARNGHITNLNVDSGTVGGFVIGTYSMTSNGTSHDGMKFDMLLSRSSLYLQGSEGSGSGKLFDVDVQSDRYTLTVINDKKPRYGETNTNTGIIVKARNRQVNIALLAEGNSLVGGMSEGYALESIQSTVANYVYSLDLRKANRFRIASFATGQSVRLPSRTHIIDMFGNNVPYNNLGRFCFRVMLFNRGYRNSISIIGHTESDTEFKYPQIYGSNGQNTNAYILESGKCVEVFLVYEETDGGEQKYTAYIK